MCLVTDKVKFNIMLKFLPSYSNLLQRGHNQRRKPWLAMPTELGNKFICNIDTYIISLRKAATFHDILYNRY